MSIRELTRNGQMLTEFDYIDIEDKKRRAYKGVFVPSRYAQEVKDFLDKKLLRKKQEEFEGILKFAGIADGKIGNDSIQELMRQKKNRYP
ncbi:MAG: hypothetical protein VX610_07350 [SAR324 cluster bacterium]|nr:hypothetical protein [SAR324 cluster bacterium]